MSTITNRDGTRLVPDATLKIYPGASHPHAIGRLQRGPPRFHRALSNRGGGMRPRAARVCLYEACGSPEPGIE